MAEYKEIAHLRQDYLAELEKQPDQFTVWRVLEGLMKAFYGVVRLF